MSGILHSLYDFSTVLSAIHHTLSHPYVVVTSRLFGFFLLPVYLNRQAGRLSSLLGSLFFRSFHVSSCQCHHLQAALSVNLRCLPHHRAALQDLSQLLQDPCFHTLLRCRTRRGAALEARAALRRRSRLSTLFYVSSSLQTDTPHLPHTRHGKLSLLSDAAVFTDQCCTVHPRGRP